MEITDIQAVSGMRTGQTGTVVALHGGYEFQARLVSMGVHVGCSLEVVHCGNGRGGPVLLAVGSARIAVGHGMLDRILVAVDPE